MPDEDRRVQVEGSAPYKGLTPGEAWARFCERTGVRARVRKIGGEFTWQDFAALAEAAVGMALHERAELLDCLEGEPVAWMNIWCGHGGVNPDRPYTEIWTDEERARLQRENWQAVTPEGGSVQCVPLYRRTHQAPEEGGPPT